MKLWKFGLTITLFYALLIIAGCSDSEEVVPDSIPEATRTLSPGELIPWDTKIRIDQSGTYELPAGATLLTTRCFGKITLTFNLPEGEIQSNTCHNTTGSSSQTNVVTGVDTLFYEVEAGSHAEVTVK